MSLPQGDLSGDAQHCQKVDDAYLPLEACSQPFRDSVRRAISPLI